MQRRNVIHSQPHPDGQAADGKACRVCGKALRDREDFIAIEHAGCRAVVCCASCAARFEQFPSLYIIGAGGLR